MADLTADQQAQIKRISDSIEACYQKLRAVAKNMSGLLQYGRATCDEVKAYNLYALSVYNTQRGMLAALRAAGQTDVPALPTFPTLFTWKGVSGADAWKLDCKASGMSGLGLYERPPIIGSHGSLALSGVLRAAIESTSRPDAQYLNTSQISIVTQDQDLFTPGSQIPSLAELSAEGGLGNPVILVIAGLVVLALAAGFYALALYMKENTIQEETTKRSEIQLTAFQDYTNKRLACINSCASVQSNSYQGCVDACTKAIPVPNIKTETGREQPSSIGFFGMVGLAASAGVAGIILWAMFKKHGHRWGGGGGMPELED
jgi:hypothetical protein